MEHLDRVVTDQDRQVGFKLNLVGEIAIVGVFIHLSGYNFLKRLTTEKLAQSVSASNENGFFKSAGSWGAPNAFIPVKPKAANAASKCDD